VWSACPATGTVGEAGREAGDRERAQQEGIEEQGWVVLLDGKGTQPADQYEELLSGGFLLLDREPFGSLQHGGGRGIAGVIGADTAPVRCDRLRLRDHIEAAAGGKLDIDEHERLQAGAKTRGCSPHTLGDCTHPPVVPGQQSHNAVGLTELLGAQNDTLVAVEAHPTIVALLDPRSRRNRRLGARLGNVDGVALGFCARTGSAVAVAVSRASSGEVTLLGRWTIDLTEGRVPDQVFHAVEGWDEKAAVGYVEEAIQVVHRVAGRRLEELVADLPTLDAVGVIHGDRERSVTVSEALASHPLRHAAEGELYRDALADAAADRGLVVTKLPRALADGRLRAAAFAEIVSDFGAQVGPPWRKEHKRATAAALVALDVNG
jgi:hypothetical protein